MGNLSYLSILSLEFSLTSRLVLQQGKDLGVTLGLASHVVLRLDTVKNLLRHVLYIAQYTCALLTHLGSFLRCTNDVLDRARDTTVDGKVTVCKVLCEVGRALSSRLGKAQHLNVRLLSSQCLVDFFEQTRGVYFTTTNALTDVLA